MICRHAFCVIRQRPRQPAPDVTDAEFRTLGLVEVLGAIGLILPVRSRRRCAWINRLAPAILLLALALHAIELSVGERP